MSTNGSTGSFLAALAAVQAEAPVLPKDKTNPHFHSKFTGLETIVATIGPLLHKHGLVWIAKPSRDESGPTLDYRLVHVETGEGEQGTMPLLLTKADSQGLGSALTYARRYALCSVLNLVSDDDDDGNTASSGPAVQQRTQRQPNGNIKASAPQLKMINGLITKHHAKPEHVVRILRATGFSPPDELGENWRDRLTGGREGSASALIDWLQSKPLPTAESDVPAAGPDEFAPADEQTLAIADEVFGKDTA